MNGERDWERAFQEDLAVDGAAERRLLWKEIGIIVLLALLIVLREVAL